MKTEEVKKLLELYYEGRSSKSQEDSLIEYFEGNDVAPEFLDEKLIFDSLHSAEEISINEGLESKLNSLIDNLAKEERVSQNNVIESKKKSSRIIFWVTGIAASLAIILSIGLLYKNTSYNTQNVQLVLRDTYTDPNQAYAETEKALLLISSKLNKGLSGIETFQEGIEKSNEIIDKNLKQIK